MIFAIIVLGSPGDFNGWFSKDTLNIGLSLNQKHLTLHYMCWWCGYTFLFGDSEVMETFSNPYAADFVNG
jgi:hypothetical protein